MSGIDVDNVRIVCPEGNFSFQPGEYLHIRETDADILVITERTWKRKQAMPIALR